MFKIFIASFVFVSGIVLFFSPVSMAQKSIPGMALIPAGEFIMGSAVGVGRKDERPQHDVYLDSFWLDQYEVTFGDFEKYLAANPRQHPTILGWNDRKVQPKMVRRPIIGLTWKRCRNYCVWKAKRLPTEAEWERAAGGAEPRTYPWGEALPDFSWANYGRCCYINKGMALHEVGSLISGKTPDGLFDMAGNIAEWVFDWYDPHYYNASPFKNPQGPPTGKYHIVRGGAWNSRPDYMRNARRYGDNDSKDFYGIGCRCAKSAKVN